MQDILVVIDMQNDFIDGALGTTEAVFILPKVAEKIRTFQGRLFFTKDTHDEDYLSTQEGRLLPIPHCIKDTKGWMLHPKIEALCKGTIVEKPTFGSAELGRLLKEIADREGIRSVTLVGLCTDICVISNALLFKAFLPEIPIIVDASCCAGVTPESHYNALKAMKCCQIQIINET